MAATVTVTFGATNTFCLPSRGLWVTKLLAQFVRLRPALLDLPARRIWFKVLQQTQPSPEAVCALFDSRASGRVRNDMQAEPCRFSILWKWPRLDCARGLVSVLA